MVVGVNRLYKTWRRRPRSQRREKKQKREETYKKMGEKKVIGVIRKWAG